MQAFIAVFAVQFFSNYVIHQIIMKSDYSANPTQWRPEMDMQGFLPYMLIGQLMTAFFFTQIFTHGYQGTGVKEGTLYGALMTGFVVGSQLVMYAVTPWQFTMVIKWAVCGLIQSIAMGMVAAKIYKKA